MKILLYSLWGNALLHTRYWNGLTIPLAVLSNSGYGIMKIRGSYENGVVNSITKLRGYVIDISAATKWTSFKIFKTFYEPNVSMTTSMGQIGQIHFMDLFLLTARTSIPTNPFHDPFTKAPNTPFVSITYSKLRYKLIVFKQYNKYIMQYNVLS